MRILVVEDEQKTADYLQQGLNESGYVVDCAANGIDGLHLAGQHAYELVILDVNLPGKDGWLTRSRAWTWAPTTTWSSRSSFPNCWHGCAP